jgi:hypothetical protein
VTYVAAENQESRLDTLIHAGVRRGDYEKPIRPLRLPCNFCQAEAASEECALSGAPARANTGQVRLCWGIGSLSLEWQKREGLGTTVIGRLAVTFVCSFRI